MTKVSVKKVREEWREHLVVASLGAVEKNIEADEWRVVHDATHGVRVNNRIWVLDQTPFPAWSNLVAYLDEMAGDEMGMHFSATFDVWKAHRRIPSVCTEWGLLASGQLSRYSTSRWRCAVRERRRHIRCQQRRLLVVKTCRVAIESHLRTPRS